MLRAASKHALRIAGVAAAYFLAGRISILLAIPPGYAAAVWPPAGIAMAAAILWGPAILPGIWLGSFAVNVFGTGGAPVAACIGVGATAQAAAGLWITRRLAGPGNPLDAAQSTLRTLFVGGILSCLVGASVGVGTLLATRLTKLEDAVFTWATWWTGDTIGVLLFLPPLLAWTANPPETWRRRRWTLTIFLLACCTAVGLFFNHGRNLDEKRAGLEFRDHQTPISSAIQRELERTSEIVEGLANFYDASDFVRREEFTTFAEPRLAEAPGLVALSWNPIVPRGERSKFEALAHADGIEDFDFLERDADDTLVRAGKRDRYVPVFYIEPFATNRDSLGFDIASEPVRASAIDAAIVNEVPTATARIKLLHEPGDAWSVLLMMPVYAKEAPHDEPEDRRAAARGLAVGVVRIDDLVAHALRDLNRKNLYVRIFDRDAREGEQLLFGPELTQPPIRIAVADLKGAGRSWQIEISPLGAPERPTSTWLVLVGGLLFTGFIGAVVLETATRQIQVERLVAVRTGELARANDELQRSNLELQRFAHVASHDLREPLRTIGTYAELLDETAPALSAEHRKSLERILGASRRMQTLVDDLLALSRLEGGLAPFTPAPLDDLVDRALENLQPAIDSARAEVEVGELPTVRCDPIQILQLFQNLLANAVKFRRDGVPPRVSITSRRVDGLWEIAVKDNGIGIAAEHHDRVFEMFERLHPRERYSGTGIGLAICRRVVDRHGGRIWIESQAAEGSVVRFTLPAEGRAA